MSQEYVIKKVPQDFQVRENLVVELVSQAEATHHYLLLRKRGYATMEAVKLIADELGLPSTSVTYGGLKDEDGITEQLIAVPLDGLPPERETKAWSVRANVGRWLELRHYGYGGEPLRIGQLEGNGFRIILRGLAPAFAEQLADRRKIDLFFLNYYDTQRFGVPDGPKRTHCVGSALLANDWDLALRTLIELNAPESPLAASWAGNARDFFAALDPRTTSFYLAAHSSAAWNAELGEVVMRACPQKSFEVTVDGIAYRYAMDMDSVVSLLSSVRELPYVRYTFEDLTPVATASSRSTVVQTRIAIGQAKPDEFAEGRASVRLGFFLPSGCYATAAVRQLVAVVSHGLEDRV